LPDIQSVAPDHPTMQSDLFEGGSVLFPEKAPWLEDLEHELLVFPGRLDDQDGLIQGLAYKREEFGSNSPVDTSMI
jgi:hypothetical protein